MRRLFGTVRPVALSTAIEGLQQPVVMLLSLACFVLIALQPVVQMHTFGEPGRLTRDCGMGFLLVFGVLVAAFTAGSALAAEIRDGTAATALAKPVSRPAFLAGKFLGSLAVAAVFAWCQTWATLLAARTAEAWVETASTASARRDALCALLSLAAPALALGLAALVNARTRRRFGLWFAAFLAALPPLAAAVLGLFARDGTWLGPAAWNSGLDLRIVPLALQLLCLLAVFCALATALTTRLATGPAPRDGTRRRALVPRADARLPRRRRRRGRPRREAALRARPRRAALLDGGRPRPRRHDPRRPHPPRRALRRDLLRRRPRPRLRLVPKEGPLARLRGRRPPSRDSADRAAPRGARTSISGPSLPYAGPEPEFSNTEATTNTEAEKTASRRGRSVRRTGAGLVLGFPAPGRRGTCAGRFPHAKFAKSAKVGFRNFVADFADFA